MWRFLKLLILVPFALLIIWIAMANRHSVPFYLGNLFGERTFEAPFFIILFGVLTLGIILGGIGSWIAHGPTRRRKTFYKRELDKLKREIERSKT